MVNLKKKYFELTLVEKALVCIYTLKSSIPNNAFDEITKNDNIHSEFTDRRYKHSYLSDTKFIKNKTFIKPANRKREETKN